MNAGLAFFDDTPPRTLIGAREWVIDRLDDGVKCPCCGQFAKEYVRRLNRGMCVSLVRMYLAGGTGYVNVPEVTIGGSREEGKLRHWGLVSESDATRDDGGRAGYWRVTDKGAEFVLGRVRVQSHCRLYDGEFRGLEGPLVTIDDCLGNRFDLAELMQARKGMLGT